MSDFEQIKQDLADSAARSDIECLLVRTGLFEDGWYDTKSTAAEDQADVIRAMEYLAHRELIEKHPDNKYWVRIKQ